MVNQREYFKKEGFGVLEENKDFQIYVKTKENPIRKYGKIFPYALVYFLGKQGKNRLYMNYETAEDRQKQIDAFKREMQERADRKLADKNFKHTLKVGDILYDSWGYDQTNIDFYQVVKVPSEKSVVIRQIKSTPDLSKQNSGYMSGYTMAVKDAFVEDAVEERRLVRNGNYVQSRFGVTRLWDGESKYYSWYA